jgi:hypothetical protein
MCRPWIYFDGCDLCATIGVQSPMAPRREWTEWHLTPAGWQRGATRIHGRGNSWADEPEDRVLSFQYAETETSASPEARITYEETWRSKTAPDIEDLLAQHGPCPRTL